MDGLRGKLQFELRQQEKPYQIQVTKPGFYETDKSGIDTSLSSLKVVLSHEQIVREQVNVTASTPGIDVEQISNKNTMNTPEIVNIPYPTSRDIRYLLPFNPGVVQDATEQVHVAGSETWETLDTMDGFDIRSPLSGSLSLRVSADAVRSIDSETTRYPVEFGRATGGVIALYTGMGDDKFRFNATNFVPSFRDLNGIRFDKFVPRFTFSGPLKRGHAWWYDGADVEYDNIYISELPANADTDKLIRGSNLVKAQYNVTQANILTAGLLYNNYHSPFDGISALVPQQSTVKRNTIAWLPYLRDQQSFAGRRAARCGNWICPHSRRIRAARQLTLPDHAGTCPRQLFREPDRPLATAEGNGTLYLPPRQWVGLHDVKAGIDVDHVGYEQKQLFAPVSYLREDWLLVRIMGLERKSVFAPAPAFTMHNAEIGAYVEDRWHPGGGWLIEPGLRFDWDEIVRRPLLSPRIAAVYSPPGDRNKTKVSAGIGIYYEHTQLDYFAQTYAGVRYDTLLRRRTGVTPTGPTQESEFTVNDGLLHEPRALNWSVGVERKLPWSIFAGANFLQKRTSNVLTFANQSGAAALAGNYLLTNGRQDHYDSEEFDARRFFANGYTLYVSYTHSSARTNAALDYLPTPSPLGPQQSGPLAWDTPNRIISWGWLPIPFWKLKNRWDFVYLIDRHTGFPFTAVNAADQVVGAAGALSLSGSRQLQSGN